MKLISYNKSHARCVRVPGTMRVRIFNIQEISVQNTIVLFRELKGSSVYNINGSSSVGAEFLYIMNSKLDSSPLQDTERAGALWHHTRFLLSPNSTYPNSVARRLQAGYIWRISRRAELERFGSDLRHKHTPHCIHFNI